MKNFPSAVGMVQIKPIQVKDAAPLFQAIVESRDCLSEFLPWAKDLTLKGEKDFLYQEKSRRYNNSPLVYCLVINGKASGMINLHALNEQTLSAEIGYWLSVDYQKLGIVSHAVEELIKHAFYRLSLKKLILRIDPNNIASQRVAEKNAFSKGGLENGLIYYELNK